MGRTRLAQRGRRFIDQENGAWHLRPWLKAFKSPSKEVTQRISRGQHEAPGRRSYWFLSPADRKFNQVFVLSISMVFIHFVVVRIPAHVLETMLGFSHPHVNYLVQLLLLLLFPAKWHDSKTCKYWINQFAKHPGKPRRCSFFGEHVK